MSDQLEMFPDQPKTYQENQPSPLVINTFERIRELIRLISLEPNDKKLLKLELQEMKKSYYWITSLADLKEKLGKEYCKNFFSGKYPYRLKDKQIKWITSNQELHIERQSDYKNNRKCLVFAIYHPVLLSDLTINLQFYETFQKDI
jgi:hypothetical protein